MTTAPSIDPPRTRTLTEYAPSTLELLTATRREGFLGWMMSTWRKHGDLIRLQMGSKTLLLVTHPDHVRHVNVTGREHYDKGESYDSLRELLLGHGIVTATGEDWRRQRRLMAPFFTPRGVEKFFPIFLSDTQKLIEHWQSQHQGSGRPVEMLDEMMQVTAAVILHSVFSTDSGDTLMRVKNSIETMVSHISNKQMRPIQVPMWVPTPGNLRFNRAKKLVTAYIQELIARRRDLPTEQWPDDLLTKMMTTKDEESGTFMAEQLLVDNGLTMFAAGHETTARTLSFLWYALSQNPEVERRLHAELDSVLGDGPPTLNELKRLPYTLQVVKEVLRLYPAAPMYARDAVADDELDGIRIPAGTRTIVFSYATHRHPEFWEEPERFDPDRWLPEREAARHAHAYHPFAIGPRICLGNNFSLLETHVMAAMLARRFKLRMKPGHVPRFDMFGTLGSANGLPMLIEAR
ncbi:cytochrome P450 [Archangium violaceum]|uniref:Cytochrome P450 n=1 Tax=Archangium violaceum Cb vi76 TaxID=1406225 RepID=A0A084SXW5_9BACT|nr:cytochrome P450 [Archangium violaceum]KFA93300.1 cytochrome P450 [Archangium violaceum Cb vi76]